MTYVVALVTLLVVLAGVIAYAGDRLGTWVGRRRLTLFGARPKRTGQIVGVAAGIVIMLTTLAVLALAFRSAAETLLNAQRTAGQLEELQDQERTLQAQLRGITSQLATLEADLGNARVIIAEAEAARDAALRDRDTLRSEAAATQVQVADLGGQLAVARADLDEVEFELEQARLDRVAALAEAATARSGIAALEAEVAEAEGALSAAERARDVAQIERVAAEAARAAAVAERETAQAQVDTLTARTDALVAQVALLGAEADRLEGLAEALTAEATRLQQESAGLQARNDQLATSTAELLGRNQTLQQLNDRLESEILAGNEQVRVLQEQVQALADRLEDQARRLVEVQQEFSRAASGEVTFARDQVVYSGALYASDLSAARDELAAFVRAASEHTARLGAGEVVLSAEQFAGLAEVISETEGSDLVRLISPRNQFNPTRVDVIVEALENTRLFEPGQLLMSRRLHVGSRDLPATQDEVRGWIAQFKADIVRFIRRSGLDELQVPIFVGSSDEGFANQLMRLTGSVVVGVIATDVVDRAGPAYVELVILY